MASLEKRRKFLPCVLHTNQRKDSYKMFIFPSIDVVVNSSRTIEPFHRTGYTTKRSTAIDLTDPQKPVYTATLQLIPTKGEFIAEEEELLSISAREENNNNVSITSSPPPPQRFITTITIPR